MLSLYLGTARPKNRINGVCLLTIFFAGMALEIVVWLKKQA